MLQFSSAAGVEPVWQCIADGTLRGVGVGYRVHRDKPRPDAATGTTVNGAVDWERFEISTVPLPVDRDAVTRGDDPQAEPSPAVEPPIAGDPQPSPQPCPQDTQVPETTPTPASARHPASPQPDPAVEADERGWSPDDTRRALFDALVRHAPRPSVPANPAAHSAPPQTFARRIRVTRQMLVHDDLGAFTDFAASPTSRTPPPMPC